MEREHLIVSNLSLQTLEENLDKILHWNLLPFVHSTSVRGVTKTLRGFIFSLRTIIEHEVQYLTPEVSIENIVSINFKVTGLNVFIF